VPAVMRMLRKELRSHGARILSVPQFRTLAFVDRRRGTSLSEAGEHIGLTLPSMSALVDGLVARGYVARRTYAQDRRRVTLVLTDRGEMTLRVAREGTLSELSKRLGRLSARDRVVVLKAMRTLRELFPEENTR
jgi:DNA-binding MarR family transcriptional regulator